MDDIEITIMAWTTKKGLLERKLADHVIVIDKKQTQELITTLEWFAREWKYRRQTNPIRGPPK
jgi:hypothetical protein